MSYNSYDALKAIMRKEAVLEQLQSEDAKKDIFYLRHVTLTREELIDLLKSEGVDFESVEAINMGDIHGDMYRVKRPRVYLL